MLPYTPSVSHVHSELDRLFYQFVSCSIMSSVPVVVWCRWFTTCLPPVAAGFDSLVGNHSGSVHINSGTVSCFSPQNLHCKQFVISYFIDVVLALFHWKCSIITSFNKSATPWYIYILCKAGCHASYNRYQCLVAHATSQCRLAVLPDNTTNLVIKACQAVDKMIDSTHAKWLTQNLKFGNKI